MTYNYSYLVNKEVTRVKGFRRTCNLPSGRVLTEELQDKVCGEGVWVPVAWFDFYVEEEGFSSLEEAVFHCMTHYPGHYYRVPERKVAEIL